MMSDSTIRRKVNWNSACKSHVGTVREVNEDSILSRPDIGLWVVADGMGGHAVGDVASQMIVDALNQVVGELDLAQAVEQIDQTLIETNNRILKYSEEFLDNSTIGSTVVCLVIRGRIGVALWAGDSRLYRFRKGKLEQITRDHSRVEELIQQGVITESQARAHNESNVITRAVGVDEDFGLEICAFDAQLKDQFLLCSDGLYNAVENDLIIESLQSAGMKNKVDRMVELALVNGANDNVSVVAIKGEFEKVPTRELESF